MATTDESAKAGDREFMRIVRYRAVGVTALIQDSPRGMQVRDDAPSRKKIPTPLEEATLGTYPLGDGTFYHPMDAFRNAMIFAATGFKIGNRASTSVVRSHVFPAEPHAILISPLSGEPLGDDDWRIDTQRCVLQKKNAVMRSRPIWDVWGCIVVLEYEPEAISESGVFIALERAGRMAGIGNYRPERGGPYGRFAVERIEDQI